MAGKDRTYVARYPPYREVTLTLPEFQVTKSRLDGEIAKNAQRGIMAAFKRAYLEQYDRQIVAWLEFDELELEETQESMRQPSGCGCDCPGCDQGYHCNKSSRGCHL